MQVVFQRVKVKVKCWVFFIPKCNDELIIVYLRCNFTVECFFKKKTLDWNILLTSVQCGSSRLLTGIYVNSNNKLANPVYHGMGMRIEDDVLITETGVEVLTASCPKHPDHIERIMENSPHSWWVSRYLSVSFLLRLNVV